MKALISMDEHREMVSACLKHLEDTGWTELIDSRFENDIRTELKTKFPNITDTVLEYVLNLVLV